MSRFVFLAVSIVVTALQFTACSDPAPESGAGRPVADGNPPTIPLGTTDHALQVLETFEVGPDVYVRTLFVDERRSSIWVGTSLGVHEVDLGTYDLKNTFTRENGLANEYVFAALADSEGGIWFGTNGGGLSRWRDGEWKTWFPMHGLADYWVYALGESSPGVLWIGTWYGANRLDTASGHLETFLDQLVNEWVYGIGVDSRGRVWFGTEGGISMFDGATWREWTHQDGLGAPNEAGLPPSVNTGLGTRSRHDLSVLAQGGETYNPNYVFCIRIGRDDAVWAGTWGGGASRFDGKAWKNLTSRDGLAGDIVFAIVEDANGVMWFGTDKGLSRFDGKNWLTINSADGMLGDAVYALAVVGDEIWAGTRRGVARIGLQ